jgi:hypothetical protein
MTRLRFCALAAALGLAVLPAAAAADPVQEIVAEMRAEGFTDITVESTLLGRIRITGETAGERREVVIDRGTGEILRDLVAPKRSERPHTVEGHG